MIVNFINKSGNWDILETLTEKNWQQRLHQVGKVWFENKETPVAIVNKIVNKEVEVESEVLVQEEEKTIEIDEDLDQEMKMYLKEKKIRGYGLLKWEWLKKKAIEEWFIFNKQL